MQANPPPSRNRFANTHPPETRLHPGVPPGMLNVPATHPSSEATLHARTIHIPRLLATIAAGASLAFGWSASGTVRSTTGTPLSGVTVSVPETPSLTTTTSAAGTFNLSGTTAIRLAPSRASDWSARVHAGELEIQAPGDGPLALDLLDGRGRTFWSASAMASNGVAMVQLPSGMRPAAAVLRVRGLEQEFHVALVIGPDGARVAPHIVAPRAAATWPTLLFRKTGFRDTTYELKSESETAISVAMRDTTPVATTCPSPKLPTGDQTRTIQVGGVNRTYILHVPSAYAGTSAVPLVVDFHPIGGTASGQAGSSPYKSRTDADGAITAYPNGLASPNMGQAWNVKGCCTNANDTGFARAIVADVRKVACVDPKRVYAVGFSMGGGMTHYAACNLADVFAAGAPAAFDLLKQNVDLCKPSRPLTMVMFRGTNDNVVQYAGGYSAVVQGMAIDFLGAKATFQKWASLNQCTGTPSAEDANGCSTYSSCAGGVQVTLCTKQGGGHEHGNAAVGWPILKKYTLP